MSQLPRYESYKDSGVQWLGVIPSHWNTMAVRRILEEHRQGYYTNEPYIENGVKLARITDIQSTSEIDLDNSPCVENKAELKEFFLQENDFLFARTGGAGSFGIVRQKDLPAVYASYLIRFRFKEAVEAEYLKFFFKSSYFLNSLVANIHGGVNQNIHAEDIKSTFLALPPIEEQKKIANFLNAKIEKVNILIAKQETLLEKLAEQRVALISHAVTKGLNPDVEMKESGVEWLGQMPKHWTRTNIKYYYNVQLGKMLQPEAKSFEDVGTKYLKAQHVQWEKIYTENLPEMWCNSKELDKYAVNNGDLLICEGGEVGRCGILNTLNEPAIIQNALHRVRSTHRADVKYLNYFIQHTAQSDWFSIICNKATIAHFTSEKLLALPTLIPPLDEQKNIIDFLDKETQKINNMVKKVHQTINTLREYRSTLITQVVTGKIDVRNLKVN
ncbi:restriction endonuclease subunit S [Acinetobacter soli]|uniref:restriction endonuclease subunit S n=1 Tax=Acinetobacter soli TaxID=487316 RepID=UPI0012502C3F|nr:restriction endonuclease subunit S [Acinetobacter soli]